MQRTCSSSRLLAKDVTFGRFYGACGGNPVVLMGVAMIMVVIVIVIVRIGFDEADVGLAVDRDIKPSMRFLGLGFAGHDGVKRLALEHEVRCVCGRFTFLRGGRQRVLSRFAVDRDIDHDGFGLDRLGGLGVAAEEIDTDAMRFIVVRQLGMVLVVAELDDVAAVGAFVTVTVIVIIVVVGGVLVAASRWRGFVLAAADEAGDTYYNQNRADDDG